MMMTGSLTIGGSDRRSQSDVHTPKYVVIANGDGLHIAISSEADVPRGWTRIGPHRTWEECENWMAANWPDMYASRSFRGS